MENPQNDLSESDSLKYSQSKDAVRKRASRARLRERAIAAGLAKPKREPMPLSENPNAQRQRKWRARQQEKKAAKLAEQPIEERISESIEGTSAQKKRNRLKIKANRHKVRKQAREPKREAKEFMRLEAEQLTFQAALEFYIRAEARAAGEKESFFELLKLQRELNTRFDALVSEHVRLLDANAENRQLINRLQSRLEKAEAVIDRLRRAGKLD